jgi:hypothetical protein
MEDDDNNEKLGSKIVGLLFILIIVYFVYRNYLGEQRIDSWIEKPKYTTQYWVSLQPDNEEAKNYRVKADIFHDAPDYYLTKVYWPNGGSSTFDDCNLDKDQYQVNGYMRCFPNDGNTISEDGYKVRINTYDKVR